jgi:hypothetical protein
MWQRHHQHRAASSTCVKHQGCQWHSSGNHCGLSVSGLRSGGATQAAGVAGLTHIVQLQCPLREPQCVVHGHRFHLVDLRITGVELRLPSLPRLLLLLSDAAVTAVPAGVVLVGCLRWWASPTLPGSGTSSARLSRWVCDLCVGGGGEGGWGWQAVCEGGGEREDGVGRLCVRVYRGHLLHCLKVTPQTQKGVWPALEFGRRILTVAGPSGGAGAGGGGGGWS